MTGEMDKAPRGGALCAKSHLSAKGLLYISPRCYPSRAHPARSKAYAMELVSSF